MGMGLVLIILYVSFLISFIEQLYCRIDTPSEGVQAYRQAPGGSEVSPPNIVGFSGVRGGRRPRS
jgi:hypothetical protein